MLNLPETTTAEVETAYKLVEKLNKTLEASYTMGPTFALVVGDDRHLQVNYQPVVTSDNHESVVTALWTLKDIFSLVREINNHLTMLLDMGLIISLNPSIIRGNWFVGCAVMYRIPRAPDPAREKLKEQLRVEAREIARKRIAQENSDAIAARAKRIADEAARYDWDEVIKQYK